MRFEILGPDGCWARTASRSPSAARACVRCWRCCCSTRAGWYRAERLVDGLYGARPPDGAAQRAAVPGVAAAPRAAARATGGVPSGGLPAGGRPRGRRRAPVRAAGRRGPAGARRRGPDARPPLLREALALWRGPALADVIDAPFAEAQAARLEELRLAAVEDRVEAELALGDHRELVGRAAGAHGRPSAARTAARPAHAGAVRQRPAGRGVEVYEDARRTLAEELGVDPSPELAERAPGGTPRPTRARRRRRPRPAGASGPADQLRRPRARSSRVGELLGERRLVTLIGPGGAGKTRLAIEAAGRRRRARSASSTWPRSPTAPTCRRR